MLDRQQVSELLQTLFRESEQLHTIDAIVTGEGDIVERVRNLRELSQVNANACDQALEQLKEATALVGDLSDRIVEQTKRTAEAERQRAEAVRLLGERWVGSAQLNESLLSRVADLERRLASAKALIDEILEGLEGKERVSLRLAVNGTAIESRWRSRRAALDDTAPTAGEDQ